MAVGGEPVTAGPAALAEADRELVAVRADLAVSAADALAWFGSAAGAGPVIGYLYTPDRTQWFRLDGSDVHGPAGPVSLAGTFELYATDGARRLRWLHDDAGTGHVVCLAEDAGPAARRGPGARRTQPRHSLGRRPTASSRAASSASLATDRAAPGRPWRLPSTAPARCP